MCLWSTSSCSILKEPSSFLSVDSHIWQNFASVRSFDSQRQQNIHQPFALNNAVHYILDKITRLREKRFQLCPDNTYPLEKCARKFLQRFIFCSWSFSYLFAALNFFVCNVFFFNAAWPLWTIARNCFPW